MLEWKGASLARPETPENFIPKSYMAENKKGERVRLSFHFQIRRGLLLRQIIFYGCNSLFETLAIDLVELQLTGDRFSPRIFRKYALRGVARWQEGVFIR